VDKINALSIPEKAIVGGGVLMLIASLFLDWYHVSFEGFGGGGTTGTGAPGGIWGILVLLISIALAGVVVATKLGNVTMPALPEGVTWGMVWGGGAAAVVVFMILKAWRISAVPIGGFGIGFFLGVIATAAIAYGGYMLWTEEKSKAA
jgi:hypothetical protein